MVDKVQKDIRSKMMAAVRGKNTSPEMIVRRSLHSKGFRFRIHAQRLPGTPDIVLPKHKVALFVNGCFWHRHVGCRYTTVPENNADFWKRKFEANVSRDERNVQELLDGEWRVVIIWACGLRPSTQQAYLDKLADLIQHGDLRVTELP